MSQRKKSLKAQAHDRLYAMLAIGESKFQAKQEGTSKDKIFSFQTYHDYRAVCMRFAEYCKGKGCKTLDECRQYTGEWMQRKKPDGQDYSPHSRKTFACALGKMFGLSMNEICSKLPERSRAGITNSRGPKEYYSRNGVHADVIRFVCATGLRSSEVRNLRGSDILEKDSQLYIVVRRGKGGKHREAPVIQDVDWIRNWMKSAGDGKAFEKVPDRLHRYRAEYATTFYSMLVREDIPPYDRYHCRKDLKGVTYDKKAMRVVSNALGHNRISVIAQSYLRSAAMTPHPS